MKLDRNENPDGRQKYALLNLRRTTLTLEEIRQKVTEALGPGVLQFGDNDTTAFFVLKLKDKYAGPALESYADAAEADDEFDYAKDVRELARRARTHPEQKKPD